MHIRSLRHKAPAGALLLPAGASAQGLTGGLEGLADAFAFLWGILGIAVIFAMGYALRRQAKKPGSVFSAILCIAAAIYAISAVGLMFVDMSDVAAKFVGLIGFIVLFRVARFALVNSERVRGWAYALLTLLLAAMLVIPNDFWKIPPLSFERIVYVDNLEGLDSAAVLRTPYGYAGRLALDDGRLLIQTQHIPERAYHAAKPPPRAWSNGAAVSLTPADVAEPGQWFEIQHYNNTYVPGARHNGQKARYVLPLSRTTVDRFSPSMKTLAYTVDDADYERLLLGLLREVSGSWGSDPDRHDPGNKYYWAERLIDVGDIDINSQAFLDRAFSEGTAQAYLALLDLGLGIDAQNSDGRTLLHVAVINQDLALLVGLGDLGVDPSIRDNEGLTAVEFMRQLAARYPANFENRRFLEQLEALR